jgi:glycyl-tRNA synthetase beta chain
VSVVIALADKLDSLISLFAADEKPTGSKDPFALRRAALGCIRLIVENELRIPLTAFLNDEIIAFFADRLKVMLKEQGYRHDWVNAIFTAREDDLLRVVQRVAALGRFMESDDGKNLLAAYKRAANIVRIEAKKDGVTEYPQPQEAHLQQAEETQLFQMLQQVASAIPVMITDEAEYTAAFSSLASLRAPVDAFFEQVTVNVEDAALRHNRLCLLNFIQKLMERVADFSKIEG